ncbi:MAG: hypothetical protein N2A97_05215, partial [Thermodesulfobacteriales bacterium]
MHNHVTSKFVFFFSEVFRSFAVTLLVVSAFALSSTASSQAYTLDLVADQQTPIPSGFGAFDELTDPVSLDTLESEAFIGSANPAQGIYTEIGGSLMLVADENTPVPGGGSGNFFGFGNPVSLGGGDVAFTGLGSSGQNGIYTYIAGTLALVAEKS